MPVHRFLHVTLGQVKSSTLALRKSFVTPKTGFHMSWPQQQISCQVVMKPTPLRTYVTARVNRASVVIKGRKLSDFVSSVLNHHIGQWQLSRFLHRNIPRQRPLPTPAQTLKRMETELKSARSKMLTRPKIFMGATLFLVMSSMTAFYKRNLVKLPLNDRKVFSIMTDEDAISWSNYRLEHTAKKFGILTEVDSDGKPMDARTKRVNEIIRRLRRDNPELDQYLTPGGEWGALCVKRADVRSFSIANSYQNGKIMFLAHGADALDDNELAFVIAHEMVHTIQKHEAECDSRTIFFDNFLHAVLKPMADYKPDFDLKSYLRNLAMKMNFVDNTTQEREADEFGFKFACKACYDYRKFPGFLTKADEIFDKYLDDMTSRTQNLNGDGEPSSWDARFRREMKETEFWCEVVHPRDEERIQMMLSDDWIKKAEEWRQEKRCPPLPDLVAVSQGIDEVNASRNVRLQSQGEEAETVNMTA